MNHVSTRNHGYLRAVAVKIGWLVAAAVGTTSAEPSLRMEIPIPVRESVLLDAADGQLDDADLFYSAIAVSGASSAAEISSYCEQLADFERRLEQRLLSCQEDNERAEAILQFMHDRIFVGDYDAGCSDLRLTLDKGTFNCVTATILFQTLSRRNGLHVTARALPGHVRSQLRVRDQSVRDIETTSRQGAAAEHDWSATPAPTARELSEVELLAKLIYNQGLTWLERFKYAEALEATELAWQLDPKHESARENVAVVVNNWSLQLSGAGEFEKAIQLLEQGRAVAPDYALLTSNQMHVYLRWMATARQVGDRAEVARIQAHARERFPGYTPLDQPPTSD